MENRDGLVWKEFCGSCLQFIQSSTYISEDIINSSLSRDLNRNNVYRLEGSIK